MQTMTSLPTTIIQAVTNIHTKLMVMIPVGPIVYYPIYLKRCIPIMAPILRYNNDASKDANGDTNNNTNADTNDDSDHNQQPTEY